MSIFKKNIYDSYLNNFFQVNHDFRKHNSEYINIEHPRWGAIMGVSTTTNVKAGEEIFTNYGYPRKLPMPEDFPWYWELKKKIEDEEISDKNNLDGQSTLQTFYTLEES